MNDVVMFMLIGLAFIYGSIIVGHIIYKIADWICYRMTGHRLGD